MQKQTKVKRLTKQNIQINKSLTLTNTERKALTYFTLNIFSIFFFFICDHCRLVLHATNTLIFSRLVFIVRKN